MIRRRSSNRTGKAARKQGGLSLVELMVGVAIGLFIVAGAATVVSTQLADTRRLTLEAQIQQDLRTALDIMSNNFRTSGAWDQAYNGVWSPQNPNVQVNPNIGLTIAADGTTTLTSAVGSAQAFVGNAIGFRRRVDVNTGLGVLQQNNSADPKLGNMGGGWQDLTDISTVNITQFSVTFDTAAGTPAPINLTCPNLCPGTNDGACWPTLQMRQVTIQITGSSVSDPSVQRQVQSTVRLRNDRIVNNMPAPNPAGLLCPA
ncbi:MAG: prepilin-type N-terminal cleavage/methylation domain-containing protein [Burkholderiales bacterium]|nr:prepilin-type N-terminal cleavage/methylation domain-containing protein [Burkholderiales bacterium]